MQLQLKSCTRAPELGLTKGLNTPLRAWEAACRCTWQLLPPGVSQSEQAHSAGR